MRQQEKFGIKFYKREKETRFKQTVEINAAQAFALTKAVRTGEAVFSRERNQEESKRFLTSEDSYFGVPEKYADMENGKIDLKPFLKEKEKLGKLTQALQTKIAPVGKRRVRVFSEHDGDFSLDRRYEIAPFGNCKRENGGFTPTLDLVIDFSFNAGVTASKISQYGAFCWAIVDVVEAAGIPTSITLQTTGKIYTSRDWVGAEGEKHYEPRYAILTKVKKPGEYLDQGNIARCFTGDFFRRAIVGNLMRVVSDLGGTDTQMGIGRGEISGEPMVEPGKLFIAGTDAMRLEPDTVAQRILEALGAKKAGAA